MRRRHPRILGIDDAPFRKRQAAGVPIVGVVMEGAALVEGVAITAFPVDGDHATDFLVEWIEGLRWHGALQGIVLGGITVAGLGLIDITDLAARLTVPVLAVTRKDPSRTELHHALRMAGLADRLPLLERSPPARRVADGLFVASAGAPPDEAKALLRATLDRSKMPEPLRVAHLIGAALVRGQSRGRV